MAPCVRPRARFVADMPSLIGTRLSRTAAALISGADDSAALERLDTLLAATAAGTEIDAAAPWLMPSSPLGQLLAQAFDRPMSPAQWAAWSQPPAEPALRFAILQAWRTEVLVPFARRFALVLVGGEVMGPPPPPPPPVARDAPAKAWDLYQAGELLQGRPLHQVAQVVIGRPPGAGLFYVWGSDRGTPENDAGN